MVSHLFKNFPEFVVVHIVKGFGIVNKAEVDVFLELFCFFDDPTDVGNLNSVSSAFSKTSLNIWKFMVHVVLKPGLENFEHYFTSVWDEFNCAVVWVFLALPKNDSVRQGLSYWRLPISPSQKKQEQIWILLHCYEALAHLYGIPACCLSYEL